jgi:transcriptional regulator with XRE-family HTH domain
MEIGKKIKKYRTEMNLSQEELADKIFVSRQSISNWENDKNYPDIKTLLLLSSLFEVSLDTLVKGDIEEMKEQIKQEDIVQLNREGAIYSILLLAVIILPIPLAHFWGILGLGLWGIVTIVAFYFAIRIEKYKKNYDIQTYKEIEAFFEGKKLNEAEKNQEYGKRTYQKILWSLGVGVIAAAVAILMIYMMP